MSRSFKKVIVYKLDNDGFLKKYYNRLIRRKGLVGNGGYFKKLNNSWNICDYRTSPLTSIELNELKNRYRITTK